MKLNLTIAAVLLSLSLLSCKDATKETIEPITPAETRSTMEYNQNQLDTIPENTTTNRDFKGGGGEPFWSLEIADKKLYFQSPDKNFKSITATVNTVDASGNTITFNSENDNETIKIALLEQECIDGMSGKKNTHKVEVSIKRNADKDAKTYEGCGSFVKE
ncbi:MAG: hypothetical protein ACTIJ9_02630 [Aequorivita sp.]